MADPGYFRGEEGCEERRKVQYCMPMQGRDLGGGGAPTTAYGEHYATENVGRT